MGLFKKSKDKGDAPVGAVPGAGGGVSFDVIKFKVNLKSGINRAQLHKNKNQNSVTACEREIAQLLADGKEGLARVRMEAALRDMLQDEALDMLIVFAEMLHSRAGLLDQTAKSSNGRQLQLGSLPADTLESLASVAYAAPRVDNAELRAAMDQAKALFGAHAIDELARGEGAHMRFINHRMRAKLDASLPEGRVVLEHLKRVAAASGVNWQPPAEFEDLQNASAAHIPTQSYMQQAPPGAYPPQDGQQGFYNIPGAGGGAAGAPMQQMMQQAQYNPGSYQAGGGGGGGGLYPATGVYADSRVRNVGESAPQPPPPAGGAFGYGAPVGDSGGGGGYGAPAGGVGGYGAPVGGGGFDQGGFGGGGGGGYGAPVGGVDGFGSGGGGDLYASAPPPPPEFGGGGAPPPPAPPPAAGGNDGFDDDLMARINKLKR